MGIDNSVGIEIVSPRGAPRYMSEGAAAVDLRASIGWDNPNEGRREATRRRWAIVWPFSNRLFSTELKIALPPGYEATVRSRSGLAATRRLVAVFGTIDSDYRGEIKVNLENRSWLPRVVRDGDRIAQLVVSPVVRAEFAPVAYLSPTRRGTSGFGSTGR